MEERFETRREPDSEDRYYVVSRGGALAHEERADGMYAARDMTKEAATALVAKLNGEGQ